jgi:predicted AlkP superfamily phosphohydrolase/phosphomutase
VVDVLWKEEKWNLMEVVITGTDRLHHFLFDAYEDESHPHHGDFLDYYRAVDALVGRLYDRFTADAEEPRNFFVLSDHGFCRTRHEVNINTVLKDGGFLAFSGADEKRLENISESAAAFGLDPSRIYLHRRGRYPRGGVADSRAGALMNEIEAAFLALRHEGQPVIRRVFRGQDVYQGAQAAHGPDLILLSEHGYDLKGRLGAAEVVSARRLQGMHTWDDAFVVTARKDLVPDGRELTLLDVPAMLMQSLGVE